MANFQKVLIKVIDDETDKFSWVHICYADKRVYLAFLERLSCDRKDFAEWLSKWAKEEFNVELPMTHTNDIIVLKKLIRDRFKRAHPMLFIESNTDHQGWIRIWVTRKMMEELKTYGKGAKI
jgi:hypothetical protein